MSKSVSYPLVNALKAIRASQPLNYFTISVVKAFCDVTGFRSGFIARFLPPVGVVRAELPNGAEISMYTRADDQVARYVYWQGWDGFQPQSTSLFFRIAGNARVTLDIGAYIGFHSLLAAHANPDGKVFAFEPLPFIFDRLKRNVELNNLSNIQCIMEAVGDCDDRAEFFYVKTGMPSSSSLSSGFMHTWPGVPQHDLQSTVVPVLTIDRFVSENGLPGVDLVKIDTEATEPQVLRGMIDTMRRHHPFIFCEVLEGQGTERELEEILQPLGYKYFALTARGPVQRERIEASPDWGDYLFTTLSAAEVSSL